VRIAESVTFGGSALDRAGELRTAEGIAAMLADPQAAGVPIWRGKPLFAGEAGDRLAFLPLGHPVLALADVPPVFLGRDAGGPRFAHDISAWEPEALPDTLNEFFDPSIQRHRDLPDGHVFAELRGAMTRLSQRDAELAATAKAVTGWHQTHRSCAKCGADSVSSMGGWQRDCPACGTHHFPRTDPVVIMLITRDNSVLIGRSPHWPEGMYSLLAGFVEPGETIEAAVRREVWEEAGVRIGRVDYLASQPWPFPSSLMFGCRGEALTKDINIDANEIEDAFWLSREDMMDVFAGRNTRIRAARNGAIAHFLIWNWLADRLH